MKNNIRNIAIVAHVDHGKTTLIDSIMKQKAFTLIVIKNRIMWDKLDTKLDRFEIKQELGRHEQRKRK